MTPPEFRHRITALGFTQRGFAVHVGANERTVRRWADGSQDIPAHVGVLLAAMTRVLALEATVEAALGFLEDNHTARAIEALAAALEGGE